MPRAALTICSVSFESRDWLRLNRQLVEHLNRLLMAGQMSPGLRSLVETFVVTRQLRLGTSNENADRLDRARSAVHLVVTSPEFCIQK